ncbi:MAG: phosphoglucomutase/phosphomannomutase family protein [Pyrinomonadaceae bacterium]
MTDPATKIKFGTDGWRAVIAREYTFANVERVAQAYADYLKKSSASRIVIVGYDRRFLSEKFAACAAEVMAGNSFEPLFFGEDVPTPFISWAVHELGAAGGIVITASHNSANFNGFKIKAPFGGSASPEMTSAVEALLDSNAPVRSTVNNSGSDLLTSSFESYRHKIETYVDIETLRATRARVVIDPIHGVGGRWVESFLSGSIIEAETIRAERDPLFGGVNPEPIDQNLGALKQKVKESGALIGLATDGDADRVGAVDDLGNTMTMLQVVPLLLLHLVRHRQMTGGVVRTFSQSVLLKKIAEKFNLKLHLTPIGFKYIADLMINDDILIGAEESGGIGVKGHIPERDGILNSLLLLEAVVASGKRPSEMVEDMHKEFGEFHFGRKDLHVDTVEHGTSVVAELKDSPPDKIAGFKLQSIETLDGLKLLFEDESWLLFRQSGTEPVLRIYSEATSVKKMNGFLDAGAKIVLDV